MRYVFKAIDFVISVVFLALCTKALCIHFYQDIEQQRHARKLPIVKDAPSLILSDEGAITQLPAPHRLARLRRDRRQPREFEQSLSSLEQGRLLIGSATSGTEGIPQRPHPRLPSLEPRSPQAGAFPLRSHEVGIE
jgi:hypothetical protein